jgi:hypothetical protein
MKITFLIGIIGFLYSILMVFTIKDLFLKLASGLFTLLFVYLIIIFGTSDYIENPSFKLEQVIVALFLLITILSLISCFRNSKLWIIDKILFTGFLLSFLGQEMLWPFLGIRWEMSFKFYQIVYFLVLIMFVYFIVRAVYTKNFIIFKFLMLYLLYQCYYLLSHVLSSIE